MNPVTRREKLFKAIRDYLAKPRKKNPDTDRAQERRLQQAVAQLPLDDLMWLCRELSLKVRNPPAGRPLHQPLLAVKEYIEKQKRGVAA